MLSKTVGICPAALSSRTHVLLLGLLIQLQLIAPRPQGMVRGLLNRWRHAFGRPANDASPSGVSWCGDQETGCVS